MVDAALLSSADSTSSVEIQPTTKPPAPIHVETINTAIVSKISSFGVVIYFCPTVWNFRRIFT